MGQTDLDKMAGEEDINRRTQPQTGKDHVDGVSEDELLPTKALPMKETPKPFNIKGGG